jgi:hypothetical protein
MNSSKYSYISIHDGHELMMMYDIHMHLDSFNMITNDGLKYIRTLLILIEKNQYILYVCIEFTHVQFFINNFQTIIQNFPKHCPIIMMRKFNVDI